MRHGVPRRGEVVCPRPMRRPSRISAFAGRAVRGSGKVGVPSAANPRGDGDAGVQVNISPKTNVMWQPG